MFEIYIHKDINQTCRRLLRHVDIYDGLTISAESWSRDSRPKGISANPESLTDIVYLRSLLRWHDS